MWLFWLVVCLQILWDVSTHWMVWPSSLRYKKALLMWVSRMRCAAWKRSSTSHQRDLESKHIETRRRSYSFWIMTFNFESGQLCGFSDFWCYWENDPILTHNFKLRGSTTKSENFGCWILANFPTVFLWVVRPKVSWAAKWEISRRSGGSTNDFTQKSKRWNEEEYEHVYIDRGFLGYQQMWHGVCFEENTKLKLPFIHEWLYMCPPYPETAAAQAGPE